MILAVLPSLGGCWAFLSEVPAAGHWGPSFCCGQRKHWQGAGQLQEVLLREGLRGSEGLLFQAAPPTHGLYEGIKWNVDECIIWDTAFIPSSQKKFYGPQERWMFLSMFLRIGVWRNLWRAYRRGFRGNLRGEGFVLGGVFVIGPGDQVGSTPQNKTLLKCVPGHFTGFCPFFQGILLEHREKEFGDRVNMLAVLSTARKMKDNMTR